MKRFVTGLMDEEFIKIAGPSVLVPSYVVFNHLCWKLIQVNLADPLRSISAQSALWRFFWGDPGRPGYLASMTIGEQEAALDILDRHHAESVLLCSLFQAYDIAWSEGTERDVTEIRDAWRSILDHPLWQPTTAAVLDAAAVLAPACETPNELVHYLDGLASFVPAREPLQILERLLGARSGSVITTKVQVRRAGLGDQRVTAYEVLTPPPGSRRRQQKQSCRKYERCSTRPSVTTSASSIQPLTSSYSPTTSPAITYTPTGTPVSSRNSSAPRRLTRPGAEGSQNSTSWPGDNHGNTRCRQEHRRNLAPIRRSATASHPLAPGPVDESLPGHRDVLAGLPDTLDRQAVAAHGRAAASGCREAETAFIIVMIWGFGSVGYGPWRTRRILDSTPDPAQRLCGTARKLRADGPVAAYAEMAGQRRLRWLGPAFGTKYLHFCSDERSADAAIILDRLVADWLRSNTRLSINSVPWSVPAYSRYLNHMARWSKELKITAAELECCIFQSEASQRARSQWAKP